MVVSRAERRFTPYCRTIKHFSVVVSAVKMIRPCDQRGKAWRRSRLRCPPEAGLRAVRVDSHGGVVEVDRLPENVRFAMGDEAGVVVAGRRVPLARLAECGGGGTPPLPPRFAGALPRGAGAPWQNRRARPLRGR